MKIVFETDVLPRVDTPEALLGAQAGPGALLELAPAGHVEAAVMRDRLHDRLHGAPPPDGHQGAEGAPIAHVRVCKVLSARYLPAFGAVISSDGEVLRPTIAEALYLTPTLAALPGVTLVKGEPWLAPARGALAIPRIAVFMAWGGRFNYGHFLIDCMSALAALQSVDPNQHFVVVSPPLTHWQRQILELFLGAEAARNIREVEASSIVAEAVLFATPMDHFLHAPNRPLDEVRTRLLAASPAAAEGPSRIYVSRRGDTKRHLLNEEDLEAALQARGFVVVAPETLSVAEQVALFSGAEIIVGAAGAAMANVLFAPKGAKVFEIQPTNFHGIWLRGLCHFLGLDWHTFFAPSPISENTVMIEGEVRSGAEFSWRVDLDAVVSWLDPRLG